MRMRTWAAMALGAVAGAGGVYLLDPDHGDDRRRRVAMRARQEAVRRARHLAAEAVDQARVVAAEARRGFAERPPA